MNNINFEETNKHNSNLAESLLPQVIFDSKVGNANNYRIPSLIYLGNGRLVACADERFFGCSDNPNRIDKVVRISEDFGLTWSAQITAVKERGEEKQKSSAAIDPSLLYEETNKTIFLLYSHTPGGVGILNSKRSTGYKNGFKVLRHNSKTYLIKDNQIFYKNRNIGLSIDSFGNVSNGGNVSDCTSTFKEIKTFFLMLTKSKDGGANWEEPVCLNTKIKSPSWGFIGACPGNGIQLKFGINKGRLVFPIYYGLNTFPLNLTFSCIYSDDLGYTWNLGKPPAISGRFPKKNPIIVPERSYLSETQIVEVGGGKILAFIRNHHPKRRIMTAFSLDGGESFSEVAFANDLPQPICQISAISFLYNGKTLVVTLNPSSEKKRENGTIRISEDGGKTFPYSKQLIPGEFAYSSMAYLDNGNIGILYEDNLLHENIKFLKINIDDLFPAFNK